MPASRIYAVLATIAALSAILAPACADASLSSVKNGARARTHAAYVDPFGRARYLTGRTDMGVDFCLRPGAPIRALGAGVIVGIIPGWFNQQPYVWYRLTDGRYAGRYVYVAEQIRSLPRVGARISAGEPLVYYAQQGTCIEMGWSAANGATLAQSTTGYSEGQATPAGASFARVLSSLGVRLRRS
jgi:murein DD-endopeptidase MepM/ murein hydrolase activator NlpD